MDLIFGKRTEGFTIKNGETEYRIKFWKDGVLDIYSPVGEIYAKEYSSKQIRIRIKQSPPVHAPDEIGGN